jgi:integrase
MVAFEQTAVNGRKSKFTQVPSARSPSRWAGACVTLLLDLGTPPHVVREIVGHSAIEVTMTIYAHVSLDEKRKALSKLGEALG